MVSRRCRRGAFSEPDARNDRRDDHKKHFDAARDKDKARHDERLAKRVKDEHNEPVKRY